MALPVPWSTSFENGFCEFVRREGYCYVNTEAAHEIVRSGHFAAAFSVWSESGLDALQSRCVRPGVLPAAAYYGAWYYVPVVAQNRIPSLGVAAGVGLHWDAWYFLAFGQLTRKQALPAGDFLGFGAEVSRVAGAGFACRGWRWERLALSPCVALWLEHVAATGVGADLTPHTRRATWLSPALGAFGHYYLLDSLALVASVSGRVEGARPILSVEGLGVLDQLAPVAAMIAAGTEWNF